jgi:hypothetical protein
VPSFGGLLKAPVLLGFLDFRSAKGLFGPFGLGRKCALVWSFFSVGIGSHVAGDVVEIGYGRVFAVAFV